MTMSAALDSGLAFALVVVFFGFIYPGWMDNFHWWGTEIYKRVRHCLLLEMLLLLTVLGLRLASLLLSESQSWWTLRSPLRT